MLDFTNLVYNLNKLEWKELTPDNMMFLSLGDEDKAYYAKFKGTLVIVVSHSSGDCTVYEWDPLRFSMLRLRSDYAASKLFDYVRQLVTYGAFISTSHFLSEAPLLYLIESAKLVDIEVPVALLEAEAKIKCATYKVLQLRELYVICGLSDTGELLVTYIFDSTDRWLVEDSHSRLFNAVRKILDAELNKVLTANEDKQYLYNFLSVYAPQAIPEIEYLLSKNPGMSWKELSELAVKNGGIK